VGEDTYEGFGVALEERPLFMLVAHVAGCFIRGMCLNIDRYRRSIIGRGERDI
jgi:hypothetical protein